VWEKLTRADVEHAKRGIASRRSEILARHAEELKALDAEQSEIDVIERAIGFCQQIQNRWPRGGCTVRHRTQFA
jgi:hypothetical protein